MRKPSVTILTGIYPPDSGGPATFAVSFSDFTFKSGYPTKVISLTDGKSRDEGSKNQSVILISRKFGLFLRTYLVVFNIAKSLMAKSLVIANGFFIETYLASILTRKKYVAKIPGDIVWERALNSKYTDLEVWEFQKIKLNFKYRLMRSLFSKSIRRAKKVVVPSPTLLTLCVSWGVPLEKIELIFNSVDVDFFLPSNSSDLKYDCIVVNRLVALKNVPEVIHACHSLNLSLLVVGEGPEMNALRQLTNDLGSDVSFAGNASPAELVHYLQSARFYILNSTADATAYSLLEARSCGLIAIANTKTGASEVINHQRDGILTQTTGQNELESALGSLLRKEVGELAVMSSMARASTVQRFNKAINFSQILELLVKQDGK
jgi:glycosyltransferase involved in cell wall biosynthesis